MDVIAGYKTGGRITGDILIDHWKYLRVMLRLSESDWLVSFTEEAAYFRCDRGIINCSSQYFYSVERVVFVLSVCIGCDL